MSVNKAEVKLEQDRMYSGRDVLLPKYTISAGRGTTQNDAHLSMARLYFRDTQEVFDAIEDPSSTNFTYGAASRNDKPSTYIGFILQQVSEQRVEKVQTVPLAGDASHSTFFGAMPVQYVFQGILFNSKTARWREAFDRLYDKYLRGYKAASAGRPVQIVYDSKVVSGWVVNVSQNISATNEMLSQFTLTLQVIRDTPLTPVTDIAQTVEDYSLEYTGPTLGITDTRVNLGPDDYVRKASIALPMRAASAGTVAGRCRVKKLTKAHYNADKEVEAKQGPVASKSPVTSTCDMAEALVYHLRRIEAADEKLKKTLPTNKKNIAKRKALFRQQDRARTHLTRLQGWAERGAKGTERLKQVVATTGITSAALISSVKRKGVSTEVSKTLNAALKSIKKG